MEGKYSLGSARAKQQTKRSVVEVMAAAEQQARRYQATIALQKDIIDRLQAEVLACKENHRGQG